jgi:hypothetical protein
LNHELDELALVSLHGRPFAPGTLSFSMGNMIPDSTGSATARRQFRG